MTVDMDILVYKDGLLVFGGRVFRCALGRSGITPDKCEGDGATPMGRFALREVLYRPDRQDVPGTNLPTRPISPDEGWSDDPTDPDYNRAITLPYPKSHERLWREDSLYDLIIPLGYNDDPPVPGKGSAIFMHVASPDYGPTEGCVALEYNDLACLLVAVQPGDAVVINPSGQP